MQNERRTHADVQGVIVGLSESKVRVLVERTTVNGTPQQEREPRRKLTRDHLLARGLTILQLPRTLRAGR